METLYNKVLRTENTVFHYISGKWYKAKQIGFEKIIYEGIRFISSCYLEFPLYSQLFACFMELQIGTTNCASVHSFVPWFILLNFVFFLSRETIQFPVLWTWEFYQFVNLDMTCDILFTRTQTQSETSIDSHIQCTNSFTHTHRHRFT